MTDAFRDPTYFEDLAVGDTSPELVVTDVGLQDFVRYAGASGDFNPMHYDRDYAREAGNDTFFGQGMFTAGVLSHVVCDWVGRAPLHAFTTRFRETVAPGDDLSAWGEIVARDDATATVDGETAVENQHGTAVITGSFRAELPRRTDR